MIRHAGDVARKLIAQADGSEAYLFALMRCLAESRGPADSEAVEPLVHTGRPAVRAMAVRVLASVRGAQYLPQLRQFVAVGRPSRVAQEALWQIVALKAEAEPVARDMLTSESWMEHKTGACRLQRWGRLTEAERMRARHDEHIAVRHAVVGRSVS